jgi:NlpC/P60 family putative phage cell wall peptidase
LAPHPTKLASLISSTSPQGGGDEIISLARSWIGTPYVHQASLKGVGCDCLGLLRGLWRDLHGEEADGDIPPYRPDWDGTRGETLRDGLARHLDPVELEAVAPGDVLLFRMLPRAAARHCAILAERNGTPTLIHARQNKRVSEEPFTPFWRMKLAYAFRL